MARNRRDEVERELVVGDEGQCPTTDQLDMFLEEELEDAALCAAIEAHIDGCKECQDYINGESDGFQYKGGDDDG